MYIQELLSMQSHSTIPGCILISHFTYMDGYKLSKSDATDIEMKWINYYPQLTNVVFSAAMNLQEE